MGTHYKTLAYLVIQGGESVDGTGALESEKLVLEAAVLWEV